MSTNRLALILFSIMACTAVTAYAQQGTPKAVVESFYKFDRRNSQTFNRKSIAARRKWMDHSLYSLLETELERERKFLTASPGEKPHFGDGLPFGPLEEACEAGSKSFTRTAKVGEAVRIGETATVPVTFAYPAARRIADIVYKVKLIGVKTKWLIVDIEYPDGQTLTADLKRADY